MISAWPARLNTDGKRPLELVNRLKSARYNIFDFNAAYQITVLRGGRAEGEGDGGGGDGQQERPHPAAAELVRLTRETGL